MTHMNFTIWEALASATFQLISDLYTYICIQSLVTLHSLVHELFFCSLGEEALNEYLKTKTVTLEY